MLGTRPGMTDVGVRLLVIPIFVIASEAKQSRAVKKGLDCFVASLLAMTPHSRFGVVPSAMPEMMIFWMLDVPSTICSDLASR